MTARLDWHTVPKAWARKVASTVTVKGKAGLSRSVAVEKKPRASFGLNHDFLIDETKIHIAVYDYLCLVLPKALVFHVPNGGSRPTAEGIQLKKMGVVPGIPDLLIFNEGAFVGAMEIKNQVGKLSAEQYGIHALLRRLGFQVAVVRSIGEAREALASWGCKTIEAK